MITNPTLHRWRDRILVAAFALSLWLHFFGFLLWGLFSGKLAWLRPPDTTEPVVALSSSTTIEHVSVPIPTQPLAHASTEHPPTPKTPHLSSQRPSQAQPQVQPKPAVAAAPPVRRELTYLVPSAPPTTQPHPTMPARPERPQPPRRATFAQQLQQEQAAFRREVAELRARDNPLSVATISPRPASAYTKEYFNISGITNKQEHVEGIITPTRTWIQGTLRCHYAAYDVEFSSGANDKGDIPWPLCYAFSDDPMTLPDGRPAPNGSPVPAEDLFPMPGYVLPEGTYLTVFLRHLYDRTIP